MPNHPAPQPDVNDDANTAAGDNANAGIAANTGVDANASTDAGAGDNANASSDSLGALLSAIADAHPDRVAGWIRNEPGHWGFFAGQAVLAVRNLIGRRLEEPERRFVWHQMWLILQERRCQAD